MEIFGLEETILCHTDKESFFLQGDPPSIFAVSDKVYWEFFELLSDRHQVNR